MSRILWFRTVRSKPGTPTCIICNNQRLHDQKGGAEAYTTYFSTLTTATLPKLTDQTPSSILFNTEKMENALTVIKPSYRTGSDGIPTALFCFRKSNITPLSLKLFFISMSTGVCPVHWKVSNIISLHENGPFCDPQNCCPTNHAFFLIRLLERTEFLTTKDLIGKSQHGFIKHRSSASSHVDSFDPVTRNVEKKRPK